jgi:hypothetical protein
MRRASALNAASSAGRGEALRKPGAQIAVQID